MRNIDKIILVIATVVFILFITVATVMKIYENDINKKYDFIVKNFIYYALLCKEEGKCTEENVSIKKLYDEKYMKKEINPKTKKYFNENSYVNTSSKEFIIKN